MQEGKYNNDEYEEIVGDPNQVLVLEDLIKFCETEKFQSELRKFRQEHLDLFYDYADMKDPDDVTHSLEFTDIFNEYQIVIESLLDKFAQKHHTTTKNIYMECRDAYEGRLCPLFQDHEHKWFVDLMLSWSDYKYFYDGMVEEAKKLSRRSKTK